MERRPWSLRVNRRLPKRYRDVLPEPVLAQPPPLFSTPTPEGPSTTTDPSNRIRNFFKTQRNRFGLFRRYCMEGPPSHDPEEHTTPDDLRDVSIDEESQVDVSAQDYYPYSNRSSFRLGEWYWNGGPQKSQASFKELVNIVGDPAFSPEDIRNTKWDQVNDTLADDEGWIHEDAGWEKTQVSITVPFQSRRNATADGTPREFVVGDFYHRSIVSVVREKLSNPAHDDLFHYEPYMLQWQPTATSNPMRVHGEIYTSPAFLNAHNELQSSPPEPECTLPRHIIALMFASDATHLTSFGDTKVWPLYLFFGNESKYRRSKPSCRLGNHVAYFHRVRNPWLNFECLIITFFSFQIPSNRLRRRK
jgi:hypothetical protein